MITDFFSFDDSENMGGCYNLFHFVPVYMLSVMPEYLSGKYSVEPTFLPTHDWLDGLSLMNKISFSDSQEPSKHGNEYPISIPGFIPKLTSEYLALFMEMANQKFIVRLANSNGDILIFGTIKEPLSFKFSRASEELPSGLSGHKYEFYGNCSLPGIFYEPTPLS